MSRMGGSSTSPYARLTSAAPAERGEARPNSEEKLVQKPLEERRVKSCSPVQGQGATPNSSRVAAAARPLSRERSARRGSIPWQAQLRSSDVPDRPSKIGNKEQSPVRISRARSVPLLQSHSPIPSRAGTRGRELQGGEQKECQRSHTRSGSHGGDSARACSVQRSVRSKSPTARADPYRLRRFTQAQRTTYAQALSEIRAGRKSSAWMWYVIPTPPHIVKNVERGSADNRKYALRSDEEVCAYLEFTADDVDLRSNYLEIMTAVRDQFNNGKKVVQLMGKMSAPKLISSARLFERVTRSSSDKELHAVLCEILEHLEAEG